MIIADINDGDTVKFKDGTAEGRVFNVSGCNDKWWNSKTRKHERAVGLRYEAWDTVWRADIPERLLEKVDAK